MVNEFEVFDDEYKKVYEKWFNKEIKEKPINEFNEYEKNYDYSNVYLKDYCYSDGGFFDEENVSDGDYGFYNEYENDAENKRKIPDHFYHNFENDNSMKMGKKDYYKKYNNANKERIRPKKQRREYERKQEMDFYVKRSLLGFDKSIQHLVFNTSMNKYNEYLKNGGKTKNKFKLIINYIIESCEHHKIKLEDTNIKVFTDDPDYKRNVAIPYGENDRSNNPSRINNKNKKSRFHK